MKLKRRGKARPESTSSDDRLEFHVRDPEEAESILSGITAVREAYGAGDYEALDSAVQAFFAAGSSHQAEKVVKTLEKTLLTDAAIGLLSYHEAFNRRNADKEVAALFAAHRRLLEACRHQGIDAAFRSARRGDVDDYAWAE